jgi:predicted Zn finger-like uncharacterized protein
MKISFACPACGASGSVDEALVGRQVRCKPCQHRFAIPRPGIESEDDGYLLEEPAREAVAGGASGSPGEAVFVASRGDEPSVHVSPRKPRNLGSKKRRSRDEGPDFDGRKWLIRVSGVFAVGLVATMIFADRGVMIAGMILLAVGMVMVLVGFAVGAFGAFSEDFLYGFCYLVFVPYTAYYLVTRWDDLRRWCICATVGVGFVTLGTAMLQWAGVAE